MKYTKRNITKHYGGGGSTTTSSTIPEWARPYMENVGKTAEAAYSSGKLGNVAGATGNQQTAFDMGKTISATGEQGLGALSDQQARLAEMAKTGGAAELQDALKLDVGMSSANLGNQFGSSGVLGSARHALADSSAEAAAKAKYAQQVITNKQAAEQALGTSVGQSTSTAGTTASNLANLGSQERTIAQQEADAPWQALQRYSSTIYGNPARQQTTASGGK